MHTLRGGGFGLGYTPFYQRSKRGFVKLYLIIKVLIDSLFFKLNHNGACFYRKYCLNPKLINRLIHSLCG
jgi:hypothetical protein